MIWFQVGELELHLFSEEPVDDPSKRYVCLQVDNLETLREHLVDAGYNPWDAPPIPGRPRFFCRDPFGNIIEFLKIEADYRAAGE